MDVFFDLLAMVGFYLKIGRNLKASSPQRLFLCFFFATIFVLGFSPIVSKNIVVTKLRAIPLSWTTVCFRLDSPFALVNSSEVSLFAVKYQPIILALKQNVGMGASDLVVFGEG